MRRNTPQQLIKWVVPYPAGGGTDVIARVLAESMRQTLGQQIVVDNRPGASTNIGADLVAKSKPDGYTVLSADNAVLAFNEHLFSKLPFTPRKTSPTSARSASSRWRWWCTPTSRPRPSRSSWPT
jgi:tripartite-type tricarboxylate transporter receptor subunit TctC